MLVVTDHQRTLRGHLLLHPDRQSAQPRHVLQRDRHLRARGHLVVQRQLLLHRFTSAAQSFTVNKATAGTTTALSTISLTVTYGAEDSRDLQRHRHRRLR